MKLYHVTPKENVRQILTQGLRVEFCVDLFDKYIALCTRGELTKWLCLVAKIYGLPVSQMYVLTVEVDDFEQTTYDAFTFYSFKNIPPRCIKGQPLLTRLESLSSAPRGNSPRRGVN